MIDRPVLVFDGECGFCRRLASKWYEKTREKINFVPNSELSDEFGRYSTEEFTKEIKLIYPEGRVYGGATAAFKVIEHSRSPLRALSWIYNRTRAFDPIWEWAYRLVARYRNRIHF